MTWINIDQFTDEVFAPKPNMLTHLPPVPHIFVSEFVQVMAPSPVRRQAITWTDADFLSTGHWGTNLREILIKIQNFSSMKIYLKLSSAKLRTFCPGKLVLFGLLRVRWDVVFLILPKTSSTSRTKSKSLNVSCILVQLFSLNPLKPGVKLRMRCSWSSADRRCSNYIWVINNFIAY